MRGTKAKRLRREVYGEDSTKAKGTTYTTARSGILGKSHTEATGNRRAYQARKRGT